ncbi:hypothetical protein P3W33_06425 [Luteibacter sp. PPL552]
MEQLIADMKAGYISSVKKGDWFLKSREGRYVTSWLIDDFNGLSTWIEFSGQDAIVRRSGMGDRSAILRFNVPDDLQLRFDPALSTPVVIPVHGQLVMSPESGACVAVSWAGSAPDEQNANLISLRDGSLTSLENPAFIFDAWSLGYAGAGGEWVEVVGRSPSAQP